MIRCSLVSQSGHSLEKVGVLPLCRDAVGVFDGPSRLSSPELEPHQQIVFRVILRASYYLRESHPSSRDRVRIHLTLPAEWYNKFENSRVKILMIEPKKNFCYYCFNIFTVNVKPYELFCLYLKWTQLHWTFINLYKIEISLVLDSVVF